MRESASNGENHIQRHYVITILFSIFVFDPLFIILNQLIWGEQYSLFIYEIIVPPRLALCYCSVKEYGTVELTKRNNLIYADVSP